MARNPRDMVVRFLGDVQGFLRSTDQVEAALSDAAREQEELAREGDTTARKLASSYGRAADSMKRDARETAKAQTSTFREAGKEAGNEFSQNLGGAISSGDLSSVAQETAGGLAATFGMAGPIGAAFSLLLAGGVAVFGGLQRAAEEAAAATQAAYDDLAGGAERLATQQTQLQTAFGKGDFVSNLAEASRLASEYGVTVESIVELIGEGNRGQSLAAAAQQTINDLTQKNIEQGGELSNADSRRRLAAQQILDATAKSSDAINGAIEAQQITARLEGKGADAAERRAIAARKAREENERGLVALSAAAELYRTGAYGQGGSVWQSQLGAAAAYSSGNRS